MTTTPAPLPRSRLPVILGIGGLVVWVGALIAGIVILAVTVGPRTFDGTFKWDEEFLQGAGADKIAMIRIEGEIIPGETAGLFGEPGLGSDDYVSMLRQAEEDEDVVGVVLRVDSPGGAVVASDDVYRAVRRLRDARKPVVVTMGDTAASGGYYIAAGANTILANPSTITGSIGVIAVFYNVEGTAQKIGLKPVIIKSGPHKDLASPFRSMSSAERVILQRVIDQAYSGFVNAVATGRGLPEAEVRKLADGRIYSGTQARDLRLVDGFGGIEEAYEEAISLADVPEARLVVYRPPGIGLGTLLSGKLDLGKQMSSALRRSGAELVGVPSKPGLMYLWLP